MMDERKCENCALSGGLMAFIPFNGGMIVCRACCKEWERLGEPRTILDYHRAVNTPHNGQHCDNCRRELHGNLRVSTRSIEAGFDAVVITEDIPRDWILCDGCNALLCHLCAPQFQTGYCNDCLAAQPSDSGEEGRQ